MKIVTNAIRNLIKKDIVPPLGRWNIEYCSTKINKKIDLSNEDHCGPCGMYKKEVNNTNIFNLDTKLSYNKIQNDNFMSILEIKNF
jgi:hypothetical protein